MDSTVDDTPKKNTFTYYPDPLAAQEFDMCNNKRCLWKSR